MPVDAVDRSGSCPICGENRYEWGRLQADSLGFHTRDTRIFQWLWAKFQSQLIACKCERCKNVQLFAD
jgi:uncharacterized UBP type Zn finger protein